jgi:signal transduction histidine kinase
MTDGIVASDAGGRILIANPAARRLLSYGPEDPLPTLQTLFRAKAAREAVAEVLEGRDVPDRVIERDGRTLAILARTVQKAGVVVVLRDLTELRRLEAVRRDFVANVSHELKTPLTSISGYAETLAGGGVDRATADRFLETIRSNASRMQALIDDLLDLSRIEAGRWEPRPEALDLEVAIDEAWSLVAGRAALKAVRFTAEVAPEARVLQADPGAVRQILGNLLDNAIRYVEPDGHITVRAHPEEGGIALAVEDDGAGIGAEHLPRLFERFYRVDPSRSREEGGTGLGLAIVRHLVDAHAGRVRAESTPRQRTTVTCWFPLG